MRKLYVMFVLFLLCLNLLSGRELTIMVLDDPGDSAAVLLALVKEYEASSGITVSITSIDRAGAFTKIAAELEKSGGPALIELNAGWLPFFAEKEYLADLTGFGRTVNVNRFNHQAIISCMPKGSEKLYGLPWFMDVQLLFVNKTYADSVNFDLEDIKTYRGFREFLFTLQRASFSADDGVKADPYGFPGADNPHLVKHFSNWIWSAGGDYIVETPERTYRSALFDDNTIRGLYRYLYFTMDNLHAPDALAKTQEEIEAGFLKGHYGAIIADAAFISELKSADRSGTYSDGFYTFLIPSGLAGSISYTGGSSLVIPRGYADDPAVRGLLAYLTESDMLDRYCRATGTLPPDTGLWKEWGTLGGYETALTGAKSGKPYLNMPFWTAAESILAGVFNEIWELVRSGTYTDEKLYQLLAAGDRDLKQITGEEGTGPPLTREEFISILSEYDNELKPIKEAPLSGSLLFICLVSILSMIFIAAIFILMVVKMQDNESGGV